MDGKEPSELQASRQWALDSLARLRAAREARALRPAARLDDVNDRLFGNPDIMRLAQAEEGIGHYLKVRRRLRIPEDEEARDLAGIRRELTEELKFLGAFLDEAIARQRTAEAEKKRKS
jgi:hypothetical protein